MSWDLEEALEYYRRMKNFDGAYRTPHYVFHFHSGSLAAAEAETIAAEQERCFAEISEFLGISFPAAIEYFLCDTAQEVGDLYGDGEPCNGFARMPNQVYAVYHETVRCIGPHEDAHILSYQINRPDCPFLREGLAMFFDKVWWSVPNGTWCRYYQKTGALPKLEALLQKEEFFAADCAVSYPAAGFFVEWFLKRWGKECFLALYRQSSAYAQYIQLLTGLELAELEQQFCAACAAQPLSADMERRLEILLRG